MDIETDTIPAFSPILLAEINKTLICVGSISFLKFLQEIYKEIPNIGTEIPNKVNSLLISIIENLPEEYFKEQLISFRKNLKPKISNNIVFDEIVDCVCEFYEIQRSSLFENKRPSQVYKIALTIIIMILFEVKGLSQKEIAELLNKSCQNISKNYVNFYSNLNSSKPSELKIMNEYKKIKEIIFKKQ